MGRCYQIDLRIDPSNLIFLVILESFEGLENLNLNIEIMVSGYMGK